MKPFAWDHGKNDKLIEERGISFEEVQVAIAGGKLLDILNHPNPSKYPRQRMFIVKIEDYVYVVPFAEDDEKIFLKTIYPSRTATKKYLKK